MVFLSAISRRKTLSAHGPAWPNAKSTIAGSARWVTSSFSPTGHYPIAPCSLCKKSFTCKFTHEDSMNAALGVFFHWLGGLASASFYVPYRGVKTWAWETYWMAGGFFSWIIAPWIIALVMTRDLMGVLHEAPASSLFWAYGF